jgi:tRNA1(Val) A37 N6-methylase TrmN6
MDAPAATTDDRLLGGRVLLRQPARGYRAAIDPVLLAAAIPVRAGERVLDLGTGVGAAALCLLARVEGVPVTGVEIAPEIAALARENAALNGVGARFSVVLGDVEAAGTLRGETFEHVMMNPPFHDAATQPPSPVAGKACSNAAPAGSLEAWIRRGLARLATGGTLTVIQRADRLGDILAGIGTRAGRITIKPIAPREGEAASRILVQAVKGRRTPPTLLAPLVLHDTDGRYTAETERILSEAVPLSLAP